MTNIQATGWYRPLDVSIRALGAVRLMDWSFPVDRSRVRLVATADPLCLDAFLGLPSGSDDDLVQFALRWGVLGACWHDGAEHKTSPSLAVLADVWGLAGARLPEPPGYVPEKSRLRASRLVDQWHRLSGTIAAVIRMHFELAHDRRGSVADWTAVWGLSRLGPYMHERPLDDQRWVLREFLRAWQREAHLPLSLAPEAGASTTDVDPRGLDAGLVYLAIEAISDGQTVLECDACGRPYLRRRPPRESERNYCDRHDRQEAWRLAQSRRRADMSPDKRQAERRKAAKRMRDLRASRKNEGGST